MDIGSASGASGVSQRMIRHWKIGLFPAPRRRESGYRDLGFPIDDVRQLLGLWADRNRSSATAKALAVARAEGLRGKAAVLEAMRRALAELAERRYGDDRPDCPIIDNLAGTS
jgi:MerR family copper efflux transcriptional regulator